MWASVIFLYKGVAKGVASLSTSSRVTTWGSQDVHSPTSVLWSWSLKSLSSCLSMSSPDRIVQRSSFRKNSVQRSWGERGSHKGVGTALRSDAYRGGWKPPHSDAFPPLFQSGEAKAPAVEGKGTPRSEMTSSNWKTTESWTSLLLTEPAVLANTVTESTAATLR